MYEQGYISDFSSLNIKEIRKNIVDLKIKGLINFFGTLELNLDSIEYAIYKNKNNKQVVEFLTILYNIIKYKTYYETVDYLYEEFGFSNNISSKIRLTTVLKGATLVQKSGIEFNYAFARVLSDIGTETHVKTMNSFIWEYAMKELGIPEKYWCLDGLFDKSLTHEEEVACAPNLLNGNYVLDGGKYTQVLIDWLNINRFNPEIIYKDNARGLFDFIFRKYVNDIYRYMNSIVSSTENVLMIDKNKVFYNTERDELDLPYGIYSVLCNNNGDEFVLEGAINVYGYTGELYTEDYLKNDNLSYIGCPILLKVGKESIFAYDLEQTNINQPSWLKYNGLDIYFSEEAVKKEKANKFKVGSQPYQIYEGYLRSLADPKYLVNTIEISDISTLSKDLDTVYKYINKGRK